MERTLYTEDHEAFREVVREFVAREVEPSLEKWNEQRLIDREVWLAAGRQGVIGLTAPSAYGGPDELDYRYRMVVCEEIARVGAASLQTSFGLQDDILMPYVVSLGTPAQRQRWIPGMVAGEIIAAIAMTEPGTGSDLRGMRTSAVRESGAWRLNGAKTFISSGIQADLVVVAARTSPEGGTRGFSLLVVEDGMEGFHRGRKLDKVGLAAQDTAELFFDDVLVPEENLLGDEGAGFLHLMHNLPQERLSIAVAALTAADAALAWTLDYTTSRSAFGQPVADFQNSRFTLAEIATELDVTRAYLDAAVLALNAGTLDAVDAAKAKWWATDVQGRVTDRLLQLYGGYGYMLEYPIARAFLDARVQRIYGGTNEIMKEIIGRDLVTRR